MWEYLQDVVVDENCSPSTKKPPRHPPYTYSNIIHQLTYSPKYHLTPCFQALRWRCVPKNGRTRHYPKLSQENQDQQPAPAAGPELSIRSIGPTSNSFCQRLIRQKHGQKKWRKIRLLAYWHISGNSMIVHFLDVVSRQGTQTSKVSPEQSLLLATLIFTWKQHTEQNPIPPIHRHPPCPVRCQSLRRRHSRRWHKRPSLCGRVFALDDLSSGIDHFSPFKVGIVGLTLLRFHGCSCTMLYLYTVKVGNMHYLNYVSSQAH